MEDESVTQVELTPEVVKHRVQQLNALFDQIENEFLPLVKDTEAAQTSTTWSSAPPAAQFRATMASMLRTAGGELQTLWTRVRELCDTLEQNARDLTTLDDTARAELDTLLKRAETPPDLPEPTPTPVPYAPGAILPGSPYAPTSLLSLPGTTNPGTSAASGLQIQSSGWDAQP